MNFTHNLTVVFAAVITMVAGCATQPEIPDGALPTGEQVGRDANRLLIVNCLLPGQLRTLGKSMSFLTPRRPAKISASECEIRGGEYVSYDRANFATSLKIWLPKAEAGDALAQTYVGEIFEKGMGQLSDPAVAASWYKKAAAQGNSRANINLGYLYESGLGVERNLVTAMNYYRVAAGFDSSELEYVTSLEVTARKARKEKIVNLEQQVSSLEAANAQFLSERKVYEKQLAKVDELESEIQKKRKQVASLVAQRAADAASPPSVATTAPAPASVVVTPSVTAIAATTETESVATLVGEISSLDEQLTASEQRNRELLAELDAQQQSTRTLRKKVAEADGELSDVRAQLTAQQRRAQGIERRIAKNEDSEAVKQQLLDELAAAQKEMKSKESVISRLRENQSTASAELSQRLADAESRENNLQLTLDNTRSTVSQLNSVLQGKEREYRAKLAAFDQTRSENSAELATRQQEIFALEQRVSRLQAMEVVNQSAVNEANARIGDLEKEAADQRTQLIANGDIKQQAELAAVELAELENQLTRQKQLNGAQQEKLEGLEREVANQRATIPPPVAAEQVATTVASGPLIEIIEPPVTVLRGSFALPMPRTSSSLELIGRVRPAGKVLSFKVNGTRSEINENGIFTYLADIADSSQLKLIAVDDAGERAELNLSLIGETVLDNGGTTVASGGTRGYSGPAEKMDVSGIEFGRYHALIIGNQKYEFMGDLNTSVNDAVELERVLRTKYGFATELLQDANRYDILAALNRKRDELTENDNLLIYFAGHGELANGKGYWLPTDAEPDKTDNWISSVSVTDLVDSMDAKHVMIVADSCYSGTLSRSSVPRLRKELSSEQKRQWYANVSGSKVRTVLTSGGVRPVIDGIQGSRHSIFATAFLDELDTGTGVVEAYDLFQKVQLRVRDAAASVGMEQDPGYSPIQFAGHESGEFLFVGM